MKICLFGASSNSMHEDYYNDAAVLGKLIAEHGHTLVYGGSERGIMKYCADALISSGGKATGIAPDFFADAGVLSRNNVEMIYTKSMSERKQLMEDISDAFAVLPGGIGTFDELFETMTLKQLNIHSKPMALLNTRNYFDPLLDMLHKSASEGCMSEGCIKLFKLCSTPEELIAYLESPESTSIKGRGLNYTN